LYRIWYLKKMYLCLSPHLRMETDQVSETMCSSVFLQYHMIEKVQKPSKSEL
jgi:hypothetical protein